MHVALCTDGVYPQAMGGMQRHSRLLAEHLARRPGIQLSVIHPHPPGLFHPALGIREVQVPPIDPQRFYLRQLWMYSGHVAARLDELRPDVVLSQGFSVWNGIGRFSSRLVVHPHGLEMFQGLTARDRIIGLPFRAILRHILRRSAVTISLGGMLTGMLQAQVKGSGARVVVIPNAVDVPAVPAAYPAEEHPLRLLFVGRFAFNKGLDLLLEVARRLEQEGAGGAVRFILAGDGPLLEQVRSASPPNVELAGRVDDDQLAALYAECHALVLPTRFEGMPTVVLEAMARARPVVVSDVGATAELVDTGNGMLLPPGDVEALYHAIRTLVKMSRTRRAELGRAGYQRAVEHHQWPGVAAAFEEVLRSVNGSHSSAGTAPRW
jgi:glycosyltransferase involved in cell wall biosynthesis